MGEEKKGPSALKAFLAGGFGGVCTILAGHPMDMVKVNMQTMPTPKPGEAPLYTSPMDCVRKIIAKDGFTGLYRGMSAPLVGVTPIFATCFWGYDMGVKISKFAKGQPADEKPTMGQIMFAGGFSAIPATAVMAPGERIKCLLQIQAQAVDRGEKPQYKGMVDCAIQLYKTGGIGSIFKGWEATLARDIPGSVGYFGAYEGLKRAFTPAGKSSDDLNIVSVFMAGGFAGIANWCIAIPPDVIKSRIQTAPEGTYKGLLDCFKVTLKEEGPSAFMKGVGPAMVRAFPANAACFLGVEVARKGLTLLGME